MSATPPPEAAPAGGSPVEALRRLKEVETETEARLAAAREAAAGKLRALTEELEAGLSGLRHELERARERDLQAAREGAEREAAAILEEGRRAVAALEGRPATLPEARRSELVRVVLGAFHPGSGSE